MISIYQLKPQFQALLRPLVQTLAAAGVTANQVTLTALFGSVFVGGLLCLPRNHHLIWLALPVYLLIRMALNAVDGMLAREHQQQTPLGAILNEVADVIADAALYIPFALLVPAAAGLVIAAIFLALLSEFIGLIGPMIGASRRYDGPMGKSDRAFVFGALALAIALYPAASAAVSWVFAIAALLTSVTCVNRARMILKEAQ